MLILGKFFTPPFANYYTSSIHGPERYPKEITLIRKGSMGIIPQDSHQHPFGIQRILVFAAPYFMVFDAPYFNTGKNKMIFRCGYKKMRLYTVAINDIDPNAANIIHEIFSRNTSVGCLQLPQPWIHSLDVIPGQRPEEPSTRECNNKNRSDGSFLFHSEGLFVLPTVNETSLQSQARSQFPVSARHLLCPYHSHRASAR